MTVDLLSILDGSFNPKNVEENFRRLSDRLRTGKAVRTITRSGEALDADDFVRVDASSGSVTLTLQSASSRSREIHVKKVDASANLATIAAAPGETVEFAAAVDLTVQGDAVRLMPVSETAYEVY